MHRTFRVLLMVLGGIVGGYFGYWAGHWAGWSVDADWPWRIGGGTGAILISMGLAVVGVLLVGLAFAVPPALTARHLRAHGVKLSGTIVERWNLGLHVASGRGTLDEFGFLVDVTMPDGATRPVRSAQWVTSGQRLQFLPGRQVTVRYDPHRPKHVLVDSLRTAA
jgi:MFS family permease